ncbi:hypothetical protein SESBI_24310 [Sesbania bispinosa]|nr:hypothetical protein SESBI_24310 [Sesbania bispinosa]
MRNNLREIPNYRLCESFRSENDLVEPTKEHKSLSQQVGAVIPTNKAQTLDPQIEKPTKGAYGALSARISLAIVGSGPEKEDKQVSQRRVGAVISHKKVITYFRKKKLVKEAPSESLPIRRSLPVVG